MDRMTLLLPALFLAATMALVFLVYCGLFLAGRIDTQGVKHNQMFGPFWAGFLVWMMAPLEKRLAGRVSPNLITACALSLCAATGVSAALDRLPAAVWLYAFAGMLDVLDGRLARHAGQQTPAGALFDSVSDRWGELFVFAGYAWYLHDTPWLLAVVGALGASMMVSYTRARAEGLGLELSGGIMQRAERIVLVAGGTLVAAWYGADADTLAMVAPILGTTMLLCAAFSGATAIHRWILAYRELARRGTRPVVADEPAVAPVPAPARAAMMQSPAVHQVRPLEQH